jgi:ribosome-associated toxin RatA of RatAB toxin-antitoxin module
MARYVTTIHSDWSPEEAFAFMADARNFAEWDPGVHRSKMVKGEEPAVGTAYDVTVTGAQLRYVTKEFEAPRRVVLEARSMLLRSYDVIDVEPRGDGCSVTYDATLELAGPLGLIDPVLGLVFDRIGDRAAAGMAAALDGEIVEPEEDPAASTS